MLVFSAIPYASTAQAQEPAARGELEEVVVTARRREESLQSVPIAVTAISGDDLEAYNIGRAADLQRIVPTLSISEGTGRRNAPIYALRGVRPTESLFGQDPSAAAYFAEVVMAPAQGTNLALYDLQSVQVLKGPQGTLFGRNTTGGAVLFTPKRPGTEFGGEVALGFGNYGMIETELAVDMPVSPTFTTRFAGKSFEKDGHQTNVLNGHKLGDDDTKSARLSAVWNITDAIENYTIASYDRGRNHGRAPVLVAVRAGSTAATFFPYTAAWQRQQARDIDHIESNLDQYEEIDVWGVINTTKFELGGGLTLKNIAGYRDVEYESLADQDGSAIPRLTESRQPAEMQSWSDELQLLGTSDKLNWTTGLYYYHEKGREFSDSWILDFLSGRRISGGSVKNASYAAFLQGTYKLTPAWSLTLGGRYTIDEKQVTAETYTPTTCLMVDRNNSPLLPGNCRRTESKTFSAPTATASLDYKPNDNLLVYLTSRLGYRSGGFSTRATNNLTFAPFEEETVTDVELGTKLDWSMGDWRYRTNVALFHQWYDNIQRTNALLPPGGGGFQTVIQNAAKATIKGAELEMTIAPTDALSLRLTYAYIDPEYTKWIGTDSVRNPNVPNSDLSTTPWPYVHKHAGSAALLYQVPLGTAGTVDLQATYAAKSGVFIAASGPLASLQSYGQINIDTLRQESYGVLDLNATWSDVMGAPLDLSAFVNNATDERYVAGSIGFYHLAFGFNTKTYSDPRTYGARLRYRF